MKRRFKTPFTGGLFMLPSRRRRFREHALRMRSLRLPKKACLGILGMCNSGYCSSVYMTSFKYGYNVILRLCFHQTQRFALTVIETHIFGRFESAFWNHVYSKISMDATAFCSNHVWKRWFGLKKLSINAPYKAAFILILRRQNQRFETPIQNADPKRRSREYCLCFPREEDDFVSMHCALFEANVWAQVNWKGVYMTSFKRGYIWFCVYASTRISVLL